MVRSNNSYERTEPVVPQQREGSTGHIAAQTFTFRELAAATKNFREDCLLGEGGFGRVYKGRLENTGQASEGTRTWNGYPGLCVGVLLVVD